MIWPAKALSPYLYVGLAIFCVHNYASQLDQAGIGTIFVNQQRRPMHERDYGDNSDQRETSGGRKVRCAKGIADLVCFVFARGRGGERY